jgi:hypothetical protein
MAATQFAVPTGAIGSVANATKTIAQVGAGTNQRVKLTGISVTTDGVTNTAVPITIAIVRQTTAGTGGVSITPALIEGDLSLTPRSTAQSGPVSGAWTGEPTTTTTLAKFNVPAFMGQYEKIYSYGQEFIVVPGGFIGVQAICPAGVNPNVEITLTCEE